MIESNILVSPRYPDETQFAALAAVIHHNRTWPHAIVPYKIHSKHYGRPNIRNLLKN